MHRINFGRRAMMVAVAALVILSARMVFLPADPQQAVNEPGSATSVAEAAIMPRFLLLLPVVAWLSSPDPFQSVPELIYYEFVVQRGRSSCLLAIYTYRASGPKRVPGEIVGRMGVLELSQDSI